jgi:hypothetical protein
MPSGAAPRSFAALASGLTVCVSVTRWLSSMALTMRTAGATRCATDATEQRKTLANTHRGSERELILIIVVLIVVVLIVVFIGGERWSWTFLERDPRNPEELPQKMEKLRQGETRNRGKAGRFGVDRPKWSPNSS